MQITLYGFAQETAQQYPISPNPALSWGAKQTNFATHGLHSANMCAGKKGKLPN